MKTKFLTMIDGQEGYMLKFNSYDSARDFIKSKIANSHITKGEIYTTDKDLRVLKSYLRSGNFTNGNDCQFHSNIYS